MSRILVRRVKTCELSKMMIFKLNHLYGIELGQFVVMYDNELDILFINERISEKDAEAFVTIAGYEGKYINDPDCEIAPIISHVFEGYGYKVWNILFRAYTSRKDKKDDELAKKYAEKIYRIIQKFEADDNMPDVFTEKERLIYRVGELARNEGRRTAKNLVDRSTEYSFLLGYFCGNGLINEKMFE